MKEYLKQYFYILNYTPKRKIILLLLAFILSSFIDIFGIGLVGVYIALMVNLNKMLHQYPALNWVYLATGLTPIHFFELVGVVVVALFVLKGITAVLIQRSIIRFSVLVSANLKSMLLKFYLQLPYSFHLKRNSSTILNLLQTQITTYSESTLNQSLQLVCNSLVVLFIFGLLVFVNPYAVLTLLAMVAFIYFIYDSVLKKILFIAGENQASANNAIIKGVNESLGSLRELRVLGKEAYFLSRINSQIKTYTNARGVFDATQIMPRYLLESSLVLFVVGFTVVSITLTNTVSMVLPVLSVFMAASGRLLPAFNALMTNTSQLRYSRHSLQLVYDDILYYEKNKSLANMLDLKNIDAKVLAISEISVKDLSYYYPNTQMPAISNVSMEIKPYESIGIIGPSGAGKSTLVNLLLGLLEPESGGVYANGLSINKQLRPWLNNFAYIPQTIYLLDDTLAQNIAFGVEQNAIDANKLKSVINMAQLESLVKDLPNGVDTIIGENGVRLSGGQRQRVALARALYHERNIIIMDEATSSLDNETEKEIVNSIKRLKGKKTMIVIAHRYSTIAHCDRVYKLDAGRLVEFGSYEEVVVDAN